VFDGVLVSGLRVRVGGVIEGMLGWSGFQREMRRVLSGIVGRCLGEVKMNYYKVV
jgi:hypothetical protein